MEINIQNLKKDFVNKKIKESDLNEENISNLKMLYYLNFDENYTSSKEENEQKIDIIKALKSGKKYLKQYIDNPIVK